MSKFYRPIFLTLVFCFWAMSAAYAQQQPASLLDSSLAPVIESFGGSINVFAKQPDGKILAGGYFFSLDGRTRYAVVRLHPNGSLDESFNASSLFTFPSLGVSAIVVQPDGKILVGGFFGAGSVLTRNIVRLNPDGSVDPTFTGRANSNVLAIALQPDGKILIGGNFNNVNNAFRPGLARLNPNGTTDTTFTLAVPQVYAIAVQPDGNLIIGGNFVTNGTPPLNRIVRASGSTGAIDTAFAANASANNTVRSLKIQPDGKIVLGGNFTAVNNTPRTNLARLNADGTLDNSFNPSIAGVPTSVVESVDIDAQGRIIFGGTFSSVNAANRGNVARVNADGTLDTTFAPQTGANLPVKGVFAEMDGGILIGGEFKSYDGIAKYRIARLNSDGSLNTSFNANAYLNGTIYDVEIQPDGKIVVAGYFFYANGLPYRGVARFNADGTIDASFADFTQAPFNTDPIEDVEIQPDGKILLSGVLVFPGDQNIYGCIRLNANGTIDNTFTPVVLDNFFNSVVKALPNGQILLGGTFTSVGGTPRKGIARLNSNGTLDTTFNANLDAPSQVSVHDIVAVGDGKIIVAGYYESVGGTPKKYLARLNADGSLDTSFTADLSNQVYSVKQLQDGSLLISGSFTTVNGVARNNVAKLSANGQLDTSFNVDPSLQMPSYVIKTYTDGRIIVAGQGNYANTLTNYAVILNPNGSTNLVMANNTWFNGSIYDVEVQNDGKVIFGGAFTKVGGALRFGLARLNSLNFTRKTLFDYDGDGKADLSVFRPSSGSWYLSYSSNNAFVGVQFGASGDLIAPADFDGDGKTDICVFRPADGGWYRLNSSNNTFTPAQFGTNGDLPVPGDFDGDGRADLTVYRPSAGSWYRINSSNNQFVAAQFGIAEDKPLVGDFDGDGKSDLTVYRPSNGTWYRINSATDTFSPAQFGAMGDLPVAADYDGDGKTDLAVYRPSVGDWYIINSSNSAFISTHFGVTEDRPAPADFDGDGKADLVVFRPSSGTWYLLRTTAGFTGFQFGTNGDVPTPSAFVR